MTPSGPASSEPSLSRGRSRPAVTPCARRTLASQVGRRTAECCEGLIRALSQVKPKPRQAEIYDTEHELFSHPLDALRYLLVNMPGLVSDWDPGPPAPGIAAGLWGRVW